MSRLTDPLYLKTDQYRDETNLNARLELHRRFSTNPYGWFPWIFDILETLPSPAHVLELGCGPAYLWKECIDRIPAGWSITLSALSDGKAKELSPSALANVRQDLENLLKTNNEIFITKDSGLFKAVK